MLRVAGTGSVEAPFAVDLRVDHRAEGGEEGVEARRVPFERAEDEDERFERRDVGVLRLSADPVLARRGGVERVARERAEAGVVAHDRLGLRPGAVDHDQRHGSLRRMLGDVDRPRAGIEEYGGAIGIRKRASEYGGVVPAARRSRAPRSAGRGSPCAPFRSRRRARAGAGGGARASSVSIELRWAQ